MDLELLSPAKNLQCGIEAINHGADAVYIGAPKFGARKSAANSLQDIEQLCRYAHIFNAKVHVALNTILTDKELEESEMLIRQLYNCGTDALIIQDLGILKLSLPAIDLHASTQMDNRSVEKIQMLEKMGFKRAVLARELSLDQIKTISDNTKIALEAFVHGALCVSYSGQCYLSEACMHRSSNRGVCAQPCRLPYSLYDANNEIIIQNKHLLSLKDMDRSDFISDLVNAGISSFKIEGRLKEVEYVKNITAYYRQKIDTYLEQNPDCKRTSFGKSTFYFTPNPEKTFHRSQTDYLLFNTKDNITHWDTPKSVGEKIGIITKLFHDSFTIDSNIKINNGDGLVFFNETGQLNGFRVNKSENNRIYPLDLPNIPIGTIIYRNYDHQFLKVLQGKSAERKLALQYQFTESDKGFLLSAKEETGCAVSLPIETEKQKALKPEEANKQLIIQLGKLGNSYYTLQNIQIDLSKSYFFPASIIVDWRRKIVELLMQKKEKHIRSEQILHYDIPSFYQDKQGSYNCNILNNKAKEVYSELGYSQTKPAIESLDRIPPIPLMYCKHCIKFALHFCPKQKTSFCPPEPWRMTNQNIDLELFFDCQHCEMQVFKR